jgi:hypothetical protein
MAASNSMMKKLQNLFAVAALLAVGALTSNAAEYSDTDDFSPNIFLGNGVNSYTSTFNLLNDGYNPATEQILSAVARFRVSDDGDFFSGETVSVTLGGVAFGSSSDFNFGSITVNNSVVGSVLAELSSTGILTYTVTRTAGDFYLDWADLTAQAGPRGVPDSGLPLAFLGLGLAGLTIVRRK